MVIGTSIYIIDVVLFPWIVTPIIYMLLSSDEAGEEYHDTGHGDSDCAIDVKGNVENP